MNKPDAAKWIPILQAYAEGKTIQWSFEGAWIEKEPHRYCFDCPPDRYRIKPEPKLREWKPEEVPVGAVIRSKTGGNYLRLIVAYEPIRQPTWPVITFDGGYTVKNLFDECEHSTDGGKTWLPCGVLEVA